MYNGGCATYFTLSYYQRTWGLLLFCCCCFLYSWGDWRSESFSLLEVTYPDLNLGLTPKPAQQLSLGWTVSFHNPIPFSMPQMCLVLSSFQAYPFSPGSSPRPHCLSPVSPQPPYQIWPVPWCLWSETLEVNSVIFIGQTMVACLL